MYLSPSFMLVLSSLSSCFALQYAHLVDFANILKNDTGYLGSLDPIFDANTHILYRRAQDPAFEPIDPTLFDDPLKSYSLNGPLLRSNWEPDHCEERERFRKGFTAALLLAGAAIEYIYTHGQAGPSYKRYFGTAPINVVATVYSMPFNQDLKPGDPAGLVPSPKFKKMDIRYNVPRGVSNVAWNYDDYCRGGNYAVLFQGRGMSPADITDRDRAMMIICPLLSIIPDHPVGDTEGESRCSILRQDNYLTFTQYTWGSVILHEITHFSYMYWSLEGLNEEWILDYRPTPGVVLLNGPANGYGPWNTVRMQQLGLDVLHNADSYAMFALEVWWIKRCGITELLDDPPKNENTVMSADDAAMVTTDLAKLELEAGADGG